MHSKSMKLTAGFTAFVLFAILALPHLVDVDRFRPQLESRLTSYLGREVHLGHMELSLLAGGARVEQISIADDPAFNNSNFLEAKSLGVGVSLVSLIFSRSLHVTSLTIEEPKVTAIQSADGKWNFSTLASQSSDDEADALWSDAVASSVNSFVLDNLKISNATIQLGALHSGVQRTTLKNINLEFKNVSLEKAMSFMVSAHTGAGKIQIQGEAGPINRDDLEQTPFHATVKAAKADLAEILSLASSSEVGGSLNLNGTVSSDGHSVHSEGTASASQLRLVGGVQPANQAVALRYQTDYAIARKAGVVHDSEILVGKNSAALSGTYSARGQHVIVHMKIAANQIPLDTLQGILPALGIALPGGSKLRGGTVSANVALDGPSNSLLTSGTVQIADSHLSGFDLGSKLSSLPGLSAANVGSDLAIVNLSTHFRAAKEGTHINGFNGEFGGIGNITGDGDVNASNHLQFKMIAHLQKDGAGRFVLDHVGLRKVPNDIPFQIVGTTSMPLIIPDKSLIFKDTTKATVTETAQRAVEKVLKPETKEKLLKEEPNKDHETAQASKTKGGFFHKLFHRKNKDNNQNTGSVQMASR
jgi:AsmA protein